MSTEISISPVEYVTRKGWQYKKRGQWLDIKRCPFCHGGRNGDLHTFAIHSVDGNYICKRGSCGVSSSFAKLMESFGDKPDKAYRISPKVTHNYVKPRTQTRDISDNVVAYLRDVRGFSETTIDACGVKSDAEGNVVFIYRDDETHDPCMIKFRHARKHDPSKNERKAWREKGGKDVLWMLEKADPSKGPLIITFGEYDAMACVEVGLANVTSVPSGDDSLDWVKNCWDSLEKFSDIIVWPDDDESGQRALHEVARRLGIHRVRVVESLFKDANETLFRLRKQEEPERAVEIIQELVLEAPAYPYDNLIRLVDVPDEPVVKDGMLSGISELDVMTGGFGGGGLTIWSGDNHAGKTTGVLGLCVVEPVQQQVPTFVYSGEMKKTKIKYWCELIAAGPNYLESKISGVTGREYWEVVDVAKREIRAWYQDLIHLYDRQGGTSEDNLFEAMEFAYMKYGCKNYVLDNLMIMVLSMQDAHTEYHRQASFTKRCKQFADDFDVHVHLVAHGKKGGDPNSPPTKADIKGASEISALADNAGAFWRVPEDVRTGEAFRGMDPQKIPQLQRGLQDTDTLLCWFKTRDSGEQANIKLVFDRPSKRFAGVREHGLIARSYGWEDRLSVQ